MDFKLFMSWQLWVKMLKFAAIIEFSKCWILTLDNYNYERVMFKKEGFWALYNIFKVNPQHKNLEYILICRNVIHI